MMSQTQKIATIFLWAFLVVVMLGLVVSWTGGRLRGPSGGDSHGLGPVADSADSSGLPVLYEAPPFRLLDQNDQWVTNEDLRGRPWVAAFIFTRCAGPCPIMTRKMATIQQSVENPEVRLVSFTLDPEHDRPEVLREYAGNFGADQSRWHFLTGASRDTIHGIARGMRITAIPGQTDDDDLFIHSTHFLLIDAAGQVRGFYSGQDDQGWRNLAEDLSALASE